ncbi:acyl-CoA dehydrogenase family protein, partial [uncultured Alistipes sp.]
ENIWGLQDCAETLNEFASEEIKAKYLPWVSAGATCAMDLTEPDAGSDLGAVMLKATWSEEKQTWLLNGVKRFITNGDGEVSLVLARTEEGTTDARGLSMLVYDKRDGGVKVRRIENKLGIKGSPTCELVFTNAPAQLVGDRKMGLIKYVMSLMNAARLGIGAQSVGLCEAAYREALKYAREREQFGKAIIRFAAVSEMLSNMKAKLQGARALLYETTRFVEIYKQYGHISHERSLESEERQEMKFYNRLADGFTPLVKLFSSEYANQLAYDCVQIHGGSGFMKDYACERLYRDARIMNIYEGTSQLQVVAAINAVTKGTFLEQIRRYEAGEFCEAMQPVVAVLRELTARFEEMTARVETLDKECAGYKDFHARRLVETAGHIIIGYLLARQAGESEEYVNSAKVFCKLAAGKVTEAHAYVMNSQPEDVALFRAVEEEC